MAKKAAKADMTTELLRGLSDVSAGSSIPLVDPSINTAPFTSRHSSNIGMMNEGMGNIINTLDGVADRENQVVVRRNQQASAMRDQGIADRKALMDFALEREGIEYDREQDAIANEREAANAKAELNSPTNKLNAYKLQQAQESAAKTKQEEAFLSDALNQGVYSSSSKEFVALGKKHNISANRLAQLGETYSSSVQGAIGDTSTWDRGQELFTKEMTDTYDQNVFNPNMATFNNELKDNYLDLGTVKRLASGEIKFSTGAIADIAQELVGGQDKGILSANDLEDVTGFLEEAQKLSGGLGVEPSIAKDAILAATGGTLFFTPGRTDTGKANALQYYKEALKNQGFGKTQLAQLNRKKIDGYITTYNSIQKNRQNFTDDLERITTEGAKQYGKGKLQSLYANAGKVPVASEYYSKDSPRVQGLVSRHIPSTTASNEIASGTAEKAAKDRARIEAAAKAAEAGTKQNMSPYLKQVLERVNAGKGSISDRLMLESLLNNPM